ncbi:hypothetical protein GF342_00390 [Candidatus Woesearchaeota archaeon]|nr:hypothetical protein [Candidatus Woesearchaeota archaeon]
MTPLDYLAVFEELRRYDDDLPNREFDDWHPSWPKLKGRGNSIVGLLLYLHLGQRQGLFGDEVEGCLRHEWSVKSGRYTTPEEIKLINRTLDYVIEYLRETTSR